MQSISSDKLLKKLTEIAGVRSAAILEAGEVKATLTCEGQSKDVLLESCTAARAILDQLPNVGWDAHSFTFYCSDSVSCVLALEHHSVVLLADRSIRLPLLEVSFQMVAQILETSAITYAEQADEA